MTQRYGALTLQLKNLSDLSNIGSTHTNIFSATGKQVLSGVGSGSFTYSARDNTLHTAVKAADGQVAYIYQTDAVASGAAMDVCCIIIDSRNITTSPDGATVTVSGADILDQLTYTNAGTGAIDNGSGGPSTTDIDDIMAFAAAGWSYTATGTGGSTRSSTGSYHATKGDNVLQLLVATAKRSGDIFRLSSYSPPAKTVAWRASADSSGVTLRMPSTPATYDGSTTDGIILSMTEETDVSERITGVRPFGAGVGDGRLDITGIDSGDTGGDPSGYSTTFASNVIVNTTLETALGYTKRIDVDFSDIGVEDGTNATQLTSAAVDLWREAINYLQERDGAKTFYRLRCIVAYDLRPGQTVAVNNTEYEGGTTGGSAVWTVNSSFTIHEVANSVGQDGIRYTDLQIANTVKKQATPERVMAEAVRKTQNTTRKTDISTSPGSVSTGRTINATQPVRIDGGGAADLSADRTLTINGLTTVGGANQVPGTNAAGTAWEYKTVTAGTGISVGHSAGAITITNSSPGSSLSGLAYVTIGNTASLSAERALTAGDGIDLTDGGANSTVTMAVDVTDFIDTSFGLTESTNNIRVNLAATSGLSFSTGALQLDDSVAGAGLTIASKVLAVGAGDGIDVAADSIAVDVTDILGNGLTETSNNITLGTPSTLTVSTSNGVTTSSHTHAITTSSAVSSATAVILATDSNGRVQVQGLGVGTAATGTGVLNVSSTIYINETADANVTTGLVINQGTADNGIITLKSSDVAHGMTDYVETDTYGYFGKSGDGGPNGDASGGLIIRGFRDADGLGMRAMVVAGYLGEAADTTTVLGSTGSQGVVQLTSAIKSGSGIAAVADSGNAVAFSNAGVTSWLQKGDGTVYQSGGLYLNETVNGFMTIGLTINQGADDGEIIALKSSDIDHGITDSTETDTFAVIKKLSATDGGATVRGYTEATRGIELLGIGTTGDTTKNSSASAYAEVSAVKKSGTGLAVAGANENIFAVRSGGVTKFIVDAEGDTHRDGSDNTYDTYHDAHLARAFDRAVSPGSVIDSDFDSWVQYGREDLVKAGILHESGFYNESRLLRLAIGAVWQEYTERQRLAARVMDLERRLLDA
jgi:hypothetical protein